MRKVFRGIFPFRTGRSLPRPVGSADHRSEARTFQAPEIAGIGVGPDPTPIAKAIGRTRAPMIATALAILLAASAASAAPRPPDPPAPDLEAAFVAAEATVRAGDYRAAAARYRDILADLETRPAPEAPEVEWTRALLQLAVVESTLGQGDSSRAAMERVLSLDPLARIDPELYSPAFRQEFEAARIRVASRPRFRLTVTTRDGTGQGHLQGRALGALPAEARLPAGTYRVGVEAGGQVRTITVDLVRDETVVLDTAVPSRVPAPDLSAETPPAPIAVDPSPPATWVRPTAWVATGLAVAAAGVATWQGIAAAGSYSDAKGMLLPDGSLKPGVDPAAYASASASYQAERRNAWIAGGSALLLGAGAAVLWLIAPSAPVEATPGGLAVRF